MREKDWLTLPGEIAPKKRKRRISIYYYGETRFELKEFWIANSLFNFTLFYSRVVNFITSLCAPILQNWCSRLGNNSSSDTISQIHARKISYPVRGIWQHIFFLNQSKAPQTDETWSRLSAFNEDLFERWLSYARKHNYSVNLDSMRVAHFNVIYVHTFHLGKISHGGNYIVQSMS